ncbi:hypothetical protein Anas_06182 [Armadillidium nasatum]|uniref:C2H2-type domain-containing protein n=1 Tax=Armadillidium nasatum TaxID=96803 RepID=A0A5N5T5A0_9CRUS|nr:hypothetical protein Anas_06182 [Armadillidium nasatum]
MVSDVHCSVADVTKDISHLYVENIKAMKTLGLTQPGDEGEAMSPCPVSSDDSELSDLKSDKNCVTDEHEILCENRSKETTLLDVSQSESVNPSVEKFNGLTNGFIRTSVFSEESCYPKNPLVELQDGSSLPSDLSVTISTSDKFVERKLTHPKTLSKSLFSRSNKTKRPSLECLVARLHNRVDDKLNSNKVCPMSVVEIVPDSHENLEHCVSTAVDGSSGVNVNNSHSSVHNKSLSKPFMFDTYLCSKELNLSSKETRSNIAQEHLKSNEAKNVCNCHQNRYNGEEVHHYEECFLSNLEHKILPNSSLPPPPTSSSSSSSSSTDDSLVKNIYRCDLENGTQSVSQNEKYYSSVGEESCKKLHFDNCENIVINRDTTRILELPSLSSITTAQNSNSKKSDYCEISQNESGAFSRTPSGDTGNSKSGSKITLSRSSSSSSPPLFSDTPSSEASQSEMMIKISDAVEAILSFRSKEFDPEGSIDKPKDNPDILFSSSNSPVDNLQNNINFSCAFKILDLLPEKSTENCMKVNYSPPHIETLSDVIHEHDTFELGTSNEEYKDSADLVGKVNYFCLDADREVNNTTLDVSKIVSSITENSPQSVRKYDENVAEFDVKNGLNICFAKTEMCSEKLSNSSIPVSEVREEPLNIEDQPSISNLPKPEHCVSESVCNNSIEIVKSVLYDIVDAASVLGKIHNCDSETPVNVKLNTEILKSNCVEIINKDVHNNNNNNNNNEIFNSKKSNDEFNVAEKIGVEKKLDIEDNITLNVPQSKIQESPTLLSDSVSQSDFKEDSENYNENKEIIKDLEFEISSNFENDYSDIKNNSLQKQNTYSNLNKCKSFVSDVCILCDTFYEDLMLHCAKSHGCITYIPICQTDSFIHYTSERTGNVLHSYSDLLYGNPYYICKCCGIFLKNMDSVRLHMNIHRNLYMIQSSQSCFCSEKTFIYPQHKFKALLFQSNYTCSNCSYIFSCEKGLLLHLKVVHFNKSICSTCGEKDITNDDCIMLHNTNHLSERNEKICETDDNVEQIWDQTHYSWNALDNHLNYFDGKINRLTHVNDLNNSDITRQHLSLPIRVDPDYATLPENLCISPTVSMVKYTKMKLDSRLTNSAADSYASKELDMNIQYLLRKKFIGKGRKRKSSPLCQKIRKKVSLASCLELKKLQSRKRNDDDDDNTENLPTRRKYARRAKTRVKKKDKLQKVNDNENIILSRTRSGMRPKDATDFGGEEEEIQLPSSGNEFSGEWVNDHTFVCCSCGAAFLDLAEVMDHKWESHPGVWCAHTMIQGQDKVPKIFCEQYLPPHSREMNKKSALKKSKSKDKLFQKKNLICTHCKLKFENRETFHFHVIDCGGINQIIINKKKQKKGMRFRRRKGQGVPSRRYPNNRNSGINSAAISSKRSAERGTGMPSGNENNPSQKAQTSSSISKRNLKFALTSNKGIRNIKVSSSRLKNILSSRKRGEIVQRSNKRNLRRLRLRKRKVEVNDNSKRVTRNSVAVFVEKTDSSLNEKRKRLPQRSMQIPEKNVGSKKEKESSLKGNERKSVKSKSNFEEIVNRENENKENAKIDIKTTSTNCIQNAIKKLVPLSKKFGPKPHLQRKCDDNLESSHHTHVNKKQLKFTRKTLEAIEMLRNHVSKQKRKFKNKISKTKESIRKDNDSDSASEPEVIRNFREKRVFGRRGLRSKKSHLPRYSLRPSISLNNEEEANVVNEKEEEGDEEEELIVKPRIGKKRKYNIGDDDETIDDTQNNKLLSATKESNNRNTVNNNNTKKRRRSVTATSESESQPVIKEQINDTFESKGLKSGKVLSRRKSLPTFKNTDSKISRFYYMAHKKFSRLKLLCQNTDSETSSFEGFCPSPKKIVRRWSTENADISMISTLDATSSKNCSTPVPKISKSRAPRLNKLKGKKRKECSKNVCKTNRKISRPVKHRKRKFLTPATVDSDSDSLSDVPLIDRKKKDQLLHYNIETDDASCESKEINKSENIDVKHDTGIKSLPETSNSSLSDGSHRKAAECKKRSSEGQEPKKKRCRVIKKTDLESLSDVPSSVRNKRKKNIGQKVES